MREAEMERASHGARRRERPQRRALVALIGLLAVMGLVAAACGSSGRDDAADDGGGGSSDSSAPASGTETFGDLASPCGEGDASGATQLGVTDTSITIGYGDDAGFQQSPGLNHEMADSIKAMIDWCNEQGGINGREVVGNYGDAKILDVNNVMLDACSKDFMLVGEGWSLDSAQEATRLGCNLAAVPGYSVSPQFANGAQMIQPVPNPIDYTPTAVAAAFQKQFPDEIKKSAVMFANYAATIDTKDKVLASYPEFGFNFMADCAQEYNISGESDWKPFAQRLKDCGAEVVYFTGSPYPNFQNLLDAANQIGFEPKWITDANFYDPKFAEWNVNGLADNVYVREAYTMLEDAPEGSGTAKYKEIVEASGGDISQLGQQAASAFLLWAGAAKECGSELTSECVLNNIKTVTTWTGGGMHAETNPGSNKPPQCGLVLKLEGTKYVQWYPETAGDYDCDPSYVTQVTGPVVDKVNLNADRIATP